jgi:hypothetical protein
MYSLRLTGAGFASTLEILICSILKFEGTFSCMTYLLNFMKIYELVQKLLVADRLVIS